MTLQWILVYRQPARTRVVRNFAIGGTSRPEGRGGGGRGVKFWAFHINGGGGNFLKYPLPGRGKFFICLNCLKISDPPLGINNEQSLITLFIWQSRGSKCTFASVYVSPGLLLQSFDFFCKT